MKHRIFSILFALVVLVSNLGMSGGVSLASTGGANTYHSSPVVFPVQRTALSGVSRKTFSPDVKILKTVRDTSVTFRAQGFLPEQKVDVLMGAYGTRGINGLLVGTFMVSRSGTLRATVNIPAQFKGSDRIDIRIQQELGGRTRFREISAYVSFKNITRGPGSHHATLDVQVVNVVKDKSVTIRIANLPPSLRFDVVMFSFLPPGNRWVNLGTIDSGLGGAQTATFEIPARLAEAVLIGISVQNTQSSIYGVAVFLNQTVR